VYVVEEADTLQVRQPVWFNVSAGMAPGDGAMAELCVAREDSVVPLPAAVSDDLAAALGLSAIAAWMTLSWRGGLKPGEHVLVLGASGTVGQVGIQAARLLGAGRVGPRAGDAHGRDRAAELERRRGRRPDRRRHLGARRPARRGHCGQARSRARPALGRLARPRCGCSQRAGGW
jgi:NADPH:quinone reductase-like Zn-dependent oxidoreductase